MRRSTGLLLAALAAAAIVTEAAVTIAVADVDPASDVLIQQDVFLPYQPEVCGEIKNALQKTASKSNDAGYPVKVAVIASQIDLGGAPQFFGHPPEYANFLGRELAAFSPHLKRKLTGVPLLVVMPQGPASYNASFQVRSVVSKVVVPPKADGNTLARLAAEAVPKMASAAGHPFQAVKIPSGCSKGSSGAGTVVPFVVPIVLLALVGLALRFRRSDQAS